MLSKNMSLCFYQKIHILVYSDIQRILYSYYLKFVSKEEFLNDFCFIMVILRLGYKNLMKVKQNTHMIMLTSACLKASRSFFGYERPLLALLLATLSFFCFIEAGCEVFCSKLLLFPSADSIKKSTILELSCNILSYNTNFYRY